jgi:hypothetical protein
MMSSNKLNLFFLMFDKILGRPQRNAELIGEGKGLSQFLKKVLCQGDRHVSRQVEMGIRDVCLNPKRQFSTLVSASKSLNI